MAAEATFDDLSDFLNESVVATLATYDSNGKARLSPVWFEWDDGGFNVTIDGRDVKARHLDRDKRASLVVYSNEPPYKGVEIRTEAIVTSDGAAEAVSRLAHRYLDAVKAERFLASTSWEPLLVRLEPGELRHWHYPDY
jgi:PPOX class probable F420-dependent enzyme